VYKTLAIKFILGTSNSGRYFLQT